jgi:hypothetical protein
MLNENFTIPLQLASQFGSFVTFFSEIAFSDRKICEGLAYL